VTDDPQAVRDLVHRGGVDVAGAGGGAAGMGVFLATRGVLSMTAVPALLGTGVLAMALVVGGGVAGALRARQTRDG